MDVESEMCLIRNNLREEGLPTKGIYVEEFRKRSLDDEKKWHRAREKARTRMRELQNMFPSAFGQYRKERFNREFFERHGC